MSHIKPVSVMNLPWPSLYIFNQQTHTDLGLPGLQPHVIGVGLSVGNQTFWPKTA